MFYWTQFNCHTLHTEREKMITNYGSCYYQIIEITYSIELSPRAQTPDNTTQAMEFVECDVFC